MKRCTCGASSVQSLMHSYYCDLESGTINEYPSWGQFKELVDNNPTLLVMYLTEDKNKIDNNSKYQTFFSYVCTPDTAEITGWSKSRAFDYIFIEDEIQNCFKVWDDIQKLQESAQIRLCSRVDSLWEEGI